MSSGRVLADTQQHAHQEQCAEQRTSSGTDEGKRNSFVGHNSQHNAHVNERLDDHRNRDTESEIAPELIVRSHISAEPAPQDDKEASDYQERTEQAGLFPNNRVNKIVLRFG